MSSSKNLTPAQRSMNARRAALKLHSQVDSKEHLKPARSAFFDRFTQEVDPDGLLPPDERDRRAQRALKAHMLGLALKSSQARTNGVRS